MITDDYVVSAIARRYYFIRDGEEIDNKTAFNRWKFLRNPDKAILKQAIREAFKEQMKALQ